jgi:hypothetical protein
MIKRQMDNPIFLSDLIKLRQAIWDYHDAEYGDNEEEIHRVLKVITKYYIM